MVLLSYMFTSKSRKRRWRPITLDDFKEIINTASIIFEDELCEGNVKAFITSDGSVLEEIRPTDRITPDVRKYECLDSWLIERFVMADNYDRIIDGKYVVEFATTDAKGDKVSEVVGSFTISGQSIMHAEGDLVADLIKPGPITSLTIYRIQHSLNNGYYCTKRLSAEGSDLNDHRREP